MAKMNPRGNNLFNLKSFNELKKDQTNIKIFKNSSFDSNFNSVQSLNTNLSLPKHLLLPNHSPISLRPNAYLSKGETEAPFSNLSWRGGDPKERSFGGDRIRSNKNIKNPKFSAILRAIRSIRLNRDEWKLIRYINLMEKKLRSNPPFGCFPSTSSSISSSNILSSEGPTLPQPPKEPYLSPNIIEAPALGPLGERRSYVFSGSFSNRVQDNPLLTKGGINVEKETKNFYIKQNNKIFSYNNIISKNILLRNMKYNFLKSTLSSILKKKIIRISEVLEDKPIKNYVLYSYLKNCIFTPPHLNITALDSNTSPLGVNAEAGSKGGISKLSLNKYKGRKFGSFINYNKIIGYKFNSTFYQAYPKNRGNIYIKDTYKLLFYLFKSMYCLISKPVLKYTNDKVTIQLFYYLNIPKKKVFRLFSISYINSIKKKWLALSLQRRCLSPSLRPITYLSKEEAEAKSYGEVYPKVVDRREKKARSFGGSFLPRGNTKIYIRWKLRKAISIFKNKIFTSPSFGAKQGPKEGKYLLFKLRKFNLTKVFQNKFKLICAILSNKFNKPVELQLIRLHHPYHDSNILVNLLSLNIKNKRKKARVAIQKIYNKKPVKILNDPNLKNSALPLADSLAYLGRGTGKIIPAFLSGLNIKIAGRLMGEPIIPRITTKIFSKGATATGKVNYLDVARITKKNRKGAYTIKITSGQNFF